MELISEGSPKALGQVKPLAKSLKSMSRAGAFGKAKNQASWALRHFRNQQGLGLYRVGSASLSSRIAKRPGFWKLLDRADQFTEEVGDLGTAESRAARSVRRTKSLEKRLASGLSEGSCWGASTSVLQVLQEHPKISPSQARSLIPGDRVAVLQVLSDLRVGVEQRNEERKFLLDHVGEFDSKAKALRKFRKSGLPDEIVDEWEALGTSVVQTRLRYGQALVHEVDAVMTKVGRRALPQMVAKMDMSAFFPDKVKVGTRRLLSEFVNLAQPVRVDCSPASGSGGHSMVFDPKNARFYDENLGWYQYGSQKEAAHAFIEHVGAFYPDLIRSTWSFHQMPAKN